MCRRILGEQHHSLLKARCNLTNLLYFSCQTNTYKCNASNKIFQKAIRFRCTFQVLAKFVHKFFFKWSKEVRKVFTNNNTMLRNRNWSLRIVNHDTQFTKIKSIQLLSWLKNWIKCIKNHQWKVQKLYSFHFYFTKTFKISNCPSKHGLKRHHPKMHFPTIFKGTQVIFLRN